MEFVFKLDFINDSINLLQYMYIYYATLINNSSVITSLLILPYTIWKKNIDLTTLNVMIFPNNPDFAGNHLYNWVIGGVRHNESLSILPKNTIRGQGSNPDLLIWSSAL